MLLFVSSFLMVLKEAVSGVSGYTEILQDCLYYMAEIFPCENCAHVLFVHNCLSVGKQLQGT